MAISSDQGDLLCTSAFGLPKHKVALADYSSLIVFMP